MIPLLVIIGMIFLSFSQTNSSEVSYKVLHAALQEKHPFRYDLHPIVYKGGKNKAHVMIICHGYGHNYTLASVLHSMKITPHHLIGFNFPDHDITDTHDHSKSTFGTIHEILPLIYLIKICLTRLPLTALYVYGFSAGGAAIINTLVALHTDRFDQELKSIGISPHDKKLLMNALQEGAIILDCPLKSVEEIIATRGNTAQLQAMAQHYSQNKLQPISALNDLAGIKLNMFVHFQNPDEILGNRDDKLFITRLRKSNRGITSITSTNEGGHNTHHDALWKSFHSRTTASDLILK